MTKWRYVLILLFVTFVALMIASQFETRYFWGDRDCMKHAYNGTYAVDPKFCNEQDRADRARTEH